MMSPAPLMAQREAEAALSHARQLIADQPEPSGVSDASYMVGYVVTLMVEVSLLACVLFVVYRLMSRKRNKHTRCHAKK